MAQLQRGADRDPGPGEPASADPGDPRDLLRHVEDVVFSADATGRWTYLSPAWTRLTGFGVEESLGTPFLDYVHPDEREHTLALFMAVVQGGADRCHHETRYLTRDGGVRWLQLRARVLRDADGVPVANVGTLTDLTERHGTSRAVRAHDQLLELGAHGARYDELPVGSLVYGPDLLLARATPLAERLFGKAALPGAPLGQVLDVLGTGTTGSQLHGEWGLVSAARRTRTPQYGSVRLAADPGARSSDLHVSVLPLPAAQGDAAADEEPGLALVLQDVTDLRRAEQQQAAVAALGQRALSGAEPDELLAEAVAVVAATLEVTHCTILELLADRDVLLARAAVGWPDPARQPGRVRLDREDPALSGLLAGGLPVALADRAASPAGRPSWFAEAGLRASLTAVVHGGDNGPFGVLAALGRHPRTFTPDEINFVQAVANVLASAIERRRMEDRTRHQALHDPLTGLANRVLLRDRLDQALRSRRRSGGMVALLLMDLDRFKEINDTLGHDAGDDVLRVVAARLQEVTREEDTVVRLGGDEFAVVVPRISSIEDAVLVAAKVRARVGDPLRFGELPLHVAASVGVAAAPRHGVDSGSLLKRADVAMYRAKTLPSGLAVYEANEAEGRPEQLAYAASLRDAVHGDQLVLRYQPKVDLTTGRVHGVEALVRWAHPVEGLIQPAEFIPLAERTGLIGPLTWWVLGAALDQARAWRDAGRQWTVSVNLSARTLLDAQLLDRVLGQLDRVQLPPEVLVLELTESAVMTNPARALAVLRRLRDTGVQLSLDDFGTGYSSLAHLRDLPMHELKVDRSFLRTGGPGRRASILGTVIDLGHTLDLRVVGEGIEDHASCVLLRELGCDAGQGYHLGRPVRAADVPERAEGWP